jgi:hypothetical protein
MTGELKGVDGNSSEQRLLASIQEKSQVRVGGEVEGGGSGRGGFGVERAGLRVEGGGGEGGVRAE